jgi:hypothetical protein
LSRFRRVFGLNIIEQYCGTPQCQLARDLTANAFSGTGYDGNLILKDRLYHNSIFSSRLCFELAPFIGNCSALDN